MQIMKLEDRNAVWLSKKLSCSHTLCYNWLKYKTKVSDKYKMGIRNLFGSKYGI
tara:strand:+ start:76 stop:237 length:162 start_codon:yes stop_codon:yes gene_type:complete